MRLFKQQPGTPPEKKDQGSSPLAGILSAPGVLCLKFQPMTREEIRREMAQYYARPIKGMPTMLINGIPLPNAEYVRELNAHLDKWIDIYTRTGGGKDVLDNDLPALDVLPDGRLQRHLEPTMAQVKFHQPVPANAEWLPATAKIDKTDMTIVYVPQADLAPVIAARNEEHHRFGYVRRNELEKAS